MRETPRRVILAIIALALITIFVIGAVELASDEETNPPASPVVTHTTEDAATIPQPSQPTNEGNQADTDQESASRAATDTTESSSAETSSPRDLPSTGSAEVASVSLGLATIALVISAYAQSRRQLRRQLRQY